MAIQAIRQEPLPRGVDRDLDGRRCDVGAAILHIPVTVTDRDGNEVGRFRSPRKLARAIIAGAVIPVDGDTVVVVKAPMVVS
jgi:hypothetical protein